MEKDLVKFNENVKFMNSKDICMYEDKKGNIAYLPLGQLIVNCEYLELNEKELKIAKFENKVADDNYKKITVKRVKDKYQDTHKKEDMGTLVEYDEEVSQIWVLRNGTGLTSSYDNKEDAKAYLEKWNNDILKQAEILK